MGFSSSIHLATNERDKVIASLEEIREHNCYVGKSGDNWVGVYSEKCEWTGTIYTSELAGKLSSNMGAIVLGVCLYEEEFGFWLYRGGKLEDVHPVGRLRRLFHKSRDILNLAATPEAKQRMAAALETKPRLQPNERLGVSEKEFMSKARQDLARVHKMSPAERERMSEYYSQARSHHEEDLKTICAAVGIKHYDWNYSDFKTPVSSDDENEPIGPVEMNLRHLE